MQTILSKPIYQLYFKRPLDLFLSLFSLILLLPLLIILAILVRFMLGKPIFFKQKRPGLNERIFTIYKFRTMTNACDSSNELLPEEFRLTKFGRYLRNCSLDEIPELFNIMKGDMSFVGPRPLLTQYIGLYNDEQKRRHLVMPGLTGLAQVYGRNSISWEEKFAYDVQYVNHVTFSGDMKIFFVTLFKVLKKDGINSPNATTMETFLGTK